MLSHRGRSGRGSFCHASNRTVMDSLAVMYVFIIVPVDSFQYSMLYTASFPSMPASSLQIAKVNPHYFIHNFCFEAFRDTFCLGTTLGCLKLTIPSKQDIVRHSSSIPMPAHSISVCFRSSCNRFVKIVVHEYRGRLSESWLNSKM